MDNTFIGFLGIGALVLSILLGINVMVALIGVGIAMLFAFANPFV